MTGDLERAAVQLVRELAARPLLAPTTDNGRLRWECLMCEAPPAARDTMAAPDSHDADCTWRRAVELLAVIEIAPGDCFL